MKSGLKCILATIATILLMVSPAFAVEGKSENPAPANKRRNPKGTSGIFADQRPKKLLSPRR
jgi:hypothetical protein